jgi:outer membrane lipoprotein-sorting protein
MSKKVFLFLALIISVTNYSFAQTNASAKNILDGVSNKLKAYKGITANFSYTTKDRKNVKRGSVDGQISIKGEKYFIKQGSTEIYSDGSKTWNYNGENEVTVSEADDESKSLTPQKLLSDFYDKDFTYNLVSSAGNYYEIAMVPTDKRKNFKQVNVFVDKAKNIITKAKVLDKGDNTIEFSLTNVNTNAAIPDTRFVFDATKHPGVEVIEQ